MRVCCVEYLSLLLRPWWVVEEILVRSLMCCPKFTMNAQNWIGMYLSFQLHQAKVGNLLKTQASLLASATLQPTTLRLSQIRGPCSSSNWRVSIRHRVRKISEVKLWEILIYQTYKLKSQLSLLLPRWPIWKEHLVRLQVLHPNLIVSTRANSIACRQAKKSRPNQTSCSRLSPPTTQLFDLKLTSVNFSKLLNFCIFQ